MCELIVLMYSSRHSNLHRKWQGNLCSLHIGKSQQSYGGIIFGRDVIELTE